MQLLKGVPQYPLRNQSNAYIKLLFFSYANTFNYITCKKRKEKGLENSNRSKTKTVYFYLSIYFVFCVPFLRKQRRICSQTKYLKDVGLVLRIYETKNVNYIVFMSSFTQIFSSVDFMVFD